MRRPSKTIWSAVLLALALAGCSSSSSPSSTSATSHHSSGRATNIAFKSPAVVHGTLPARYTCDGDNVSPPLEWGAVPPHVKELAVFVFGPIQSSSKEGTQVSVEWSLAGINPALHRLAADELPSGTRVGTTMYGKAHHYSLCPAKGTTERYQFVLYAVPPSFKVPTKFASQQLLLAIADPESAATAKAGGAFYASYTRR